MSDGRLADGASASPKELVAVGVLAGAMFFRMFGVFAALPVAAVFAASLPGGEALWVVGIVVGGYGITQALLQIPAGMLADTWGRKPVLVLMLLVFAAGGFVAAAAETAWQLAGGRLLQGGGAVAAVVAAWIADTTAPQRRAKAMLVYGSGIALAFALSLFLVPPFAGARGVPAVFELSGWLGVLSAAAVLCLPSPPPPSAKTQAPAVNRQVAECAAAAFISHYALAALFLQTPELLREYLPLGEHWKIYTPAFLLSLAAAVPMVFRGGGAAVSFLLLAAGMAAVLGGDGAWWAGAGLAIFFAGFVVLEALIPARTSRVAPPEKRGAALGTVMSMEFLGMFCGGAASGALIDIFGGVGAFSALMALILAGFVIMWRSR